MSEVPTKFRLEADTTDVVPMIRPHRTFYGRTRKKDEPELVELEFGEEEPIFAFVPDAGESPKGRSVTAAGGIIITADPDLYGTEADRVAAGQKPLTRLKWGEWNMIGL